LRNRKISLFGTTKKKLPFKMKKSSMLNTREIKLKNSLRKAKKDSVLSQLNFVKQLRRHLMILRAANNKPIRNI